MWGGGGIIIRAFKCDIFKSDYLEGRTNIISPVYFGENSSLAANEIFSRHLPFKS